MYIICGWWFQPIFFWSIQVIIPFLGTDYFDSIFDVLCITLAKNSKCWNYWEPVLLLQEAEPTPCKSQHVSPWIWGNLTQNVNALLSLWFSSAHELKFLPRNRFLTVWFWRKWWEKYKHHCIMCFPASSKYIHIYIYIYRHIYGKCVGFARTRNDDRRRIIIIRIKPLLKIFNECRSLTGWWELNPYWRSSMNVEI